jgi:hypothetical protein
MCSVRIPFGAYVSDSRRRCGWRPPYFDLVLADFARCSDRCFDSVSFLLGPFDCGDFFGGATIGCTLAPTIVAAQQRLSRPLRSRIERGWDGAEAAEGDP